MRDRPSNPDGVWSSIRTRIDAPPGQILAFFADDCVFEDVTFGVVALGKEELRGFVNGAFAAVTATMS